MENLDKFGALKSEEVNTNDEDRTSWSGKSKLEISFY